MEFCRGLAILSTITMKKLLANILTLALTMIPSSPVHADEIIFTTQKAIGETITLYFDKKEAADISVEGADKEKEEAFYRMKITYKLTAQEVKLTGNITYFMCRDNKLTSLDISKSTKLTGLECNDNFLTSLDVSHHKELIELYCGNNKLTSLDVSQNKALTGLGCSFNKLTSLDLSNNKELNNIECNNNELATLDISANTKLHRLDCRHNQLEVLDVSQNTNLSYLSCSFNKLPSLNVSNTQKLRVLECRNNQLSSLSASNTALVTLGCENNQLSSLDLSNNSSLNQLYCNNNLLTSLNVTDCKYLEEIYCYENRIKGTDMDKLIQSLRKTGEYAYFVVHIKGVPDEKQNVCTTAQVEAVQERGWMALTFNPDNNDIEEYAGSTASHIATTNVTKNNQPAIYDTTGKQTNRLQKGINLVKAANGEVRKVFK